LQSSGGYGRIKFGGGKKGALRNDYHNDYRWCGSLCNMGGQEDLSGQKEWFLLWRLHRLFQQTIL